MNRSTALRDTEQVSRPHPAWSGYGFAPPDLRGLRDITAEAVDRPQVDHTRSRLEELGRQRADGTWAPWAADLRERGSAMRRETLTDLEGHLTRLSEKLSAHGVVVHRVGSAAEAAATVGGIAVSHGVTLVAKSKSMATEEIGLTPHLEGLGVDVVETDLGEYIAQVAGERPSHIVGPVLHMSRQDVTEVFSQIAGEPLSGEPDDLAAFARQRLRADFRAAEMGVCGVNFAAADTGTLVVVSNEGNVDMVVSQPELLVAVMPVEKVIPRLADIGVLVPLLCDTANKEFVTAYQTLLTGPRRPGETDGPREMHVVIFDNGRTKLLGTPQQEILACIRCGNCQFSCPVFRAVGGGHAYAAVYGGPVGAVLSPLIGDPAEHADLPFLCSLCGACADACPVGIPLPELLLEGRAAAEEGHVDLDHVVWGAWSQLWSRPALYRLTVALARIVGRTVPDRLLARAPLVRDWATGRTVPPLGRAGDARRRFSAATGSGTATAGPGKGQNR